VHEPDASRPGLGQQPGDDAIFIGIGRINEHVDIGFVAHGGGEPQDRYGGRGQPGQAPPEHVPHAFRDVGHRHQRALAGQQFRALFEVEGVPSDGEPAGSGAVRVEGVRPAPVPP
jgi:hypothetical protein